MLKGLWGVGPGNAESAAVTLWHWIGANSVELLLAIFFLQGICTLWLALHVNALTRHLRRASRMSEQYAALTQGVCRAVADLRTRLDSLEFAIPPSEGASAVHDEALAELVRTEVALQMNSAKAESAGKRKTNRTPARSGQLISELDRTPAE